ncbi:MAG TPA: membrane protein insertion efficiency factor YidD [Sutterella sp.]|nr:membrane protein insertion efficiency factor YidD [Sutterella sp.]
MTKLLIGLIKIYQVSLSPWVGRACRFEPTCSRYAIEALTKFGFMKGSYLMVARILRCNPWGGFGYDPVPKTFSWRPWIDNSRPRKGR